MSKDYQRGVSQITSELNIAKDCSGSDMDILSERILVLNWFDGETGIHITIDYKEATKLKKFIDAYIEEVYAYKQ